MALRKRTAQEIIDACIQENRFAEYTLYYGLWTTSVASALWGWPVLSGYVFRPNEFAGSRHYSGRRT
jgi:hypothetical protein